MTARSCRVRACGTRPCRLHGHRRRQLPPDQHRGDLPDLRQRAAVDPGNRTRGVLAARLGTRRRAAATRRDLRSAPLGHDDPLADPGRQRRFVPTEVRRTGCRCDPASVWLCPRATFEDSFRRCTGCSSTTEGPRLCLAPEGPIHAGPAVGSIPVSVDLTAAAPAAFGFWRSWSRGDVVYLGVRRRGHAPLSAPETRYLDQGLIVHRVRSLTIAWSVRCGSATRPRSRHPTGGHHPVRETHSCVAPFAVWRIPSSTAASSHGRIRVRHPCTRSRRRRRVLSPWPFLSPPHNSRTVRRGLDRSAEYTPHPDEDPRPGRATVRL